MIRILLAGLLIPAALLFNLIFYLLMDRTIMQSSHELTLLTNTSMAVVIEAGWLLIWRSSVKWTRGRMARTIVCFVVTAVAGIAAGWCTSRRFNDDFGIFVSAATAGLLWCAGTALLWRESTAERAIRIARQSGMALHCPACGYNMTGLHEARCPECGAEFTLDALYAAQSTQAAVDLERV